MGLQVLLVIPVGQNGRHLQTRSELCCINRTFGLTLHSRDIGNSIAEVGSNLKQAESALPEFNRMTKILLTGTLLESCVDQFMNSRTQTRAASLTVPAMVPPVGAVKVDEEQWGE